MLTQTKMEGRSLKSVSKMSNSWLDIVSERVKERNLKESEPFRVIYQSNYELWKKCVYLDSSRIAAKHNLAILEHETADSVGKGEFEQSVRNFTRRCHILHTELKAYNNTGRDSTTLHGINLSRVIYDQKKQLANKDEELQMAKSQLTESFSKFAQFEEDQRADKQRISELERRAMDLEAALLEKNNMVENLIAENTNLTERIITEKNKSASQMDEMHQLFARMSIPK